MNRKQRTIFLRVVFWAVVFAVPGVWLWKADRQEWLNRQLIAAIKREDTPAALLALEQGADGNARDEPVTPGWKRLWDLVRGRKAPPSLGATPLLLMLQYEYATTDTTPEDPPREHTDLVEALLAHGADVNLRYEGRQTPLLYALADSKKTATIRLLLEHGASVNDGLGAELLSFAIGCGNDSSILELLIQHGADPDHAENKNYTPLAAAVYCRNRSAIACLLSHHADPNVLMWGTQDPVHPLEFAETFHMTEIARLLRAAGARR